MIILTLYTLLQAIWPYSGHYHPTEENFREFISFLEENHVDLSNVKVKINALFKLSYTFIKKMLIKFDILCMYDSLYESFDNLLIFYYLFS